MQVAKPFQEKIDLFMRKLIKPDNAIDNPDVTTRQLLKVNIKADHHSAIRRLQTAMYHSGYNVKVSEFFDRIDMDRFVIWSVSRFLSEKSTIVPTPIERASPIER